LADGVEITPSAYLDIGEQLSQVEGPGEDRDDRAFIGHPGILVAVFLGSFGLLDILQSPESVQLTGALSTLIEMAPQLVFSAAFLGILLTSFGVLLQALYLSGDMDFLISIPIPIRAVFIAKLLQAVLPNLGLIGLFALPVLFGIAASESYRLLYYPLVILTLIALALAAAGISGLLVMVIVRFLPAKRVAEVLGFLGAIVSIICSQSGQLANFGVVNSQHAGQVAGLLERFNSPWSPLTWAGRGLLAIGKGDWVAGLGSTAVTLVLAGVVFLVALTTAEKFYITGWARIKNQGQKKKAPRVKASPGKDARSIQVLTNWVSRVLPSAVRAVLSKDFRVLRRDLRNMSQLVTPLIFGVVYAIMIFRSGNSIPEGRGEAPAWFMDILQSLSLYTSVGLALFVSWMLLGRLAGMGFSQEGKNYWLIKTAPVSESQLILSKFLVAYLPTLGLSLVFVIVTWLLKNTGVSVFLYSLPVVALAITGNAGINLAFGITGANMVWEDPRRMQKSGSSCLGALVTMIYLPLVLLLFFAPPLGATALGLPGYVGQLTGLVLGASFSLGCAIVPLWLARKKVARLGES
jgi:ABC-2 type transport system permease protein